MVITFRFICMVLAFVLLVLAALGVTSQRINLFAAGMALWALAVIVA